MGECVGTAVGIQLPDFQHYTLQISQVGFWLNFSLALLCRAFTQPKVVKELRVCWLKILGCTWQLASRA